MQSNNSTGDHNFIYRIMKTKEKRHSKFLERFWAQRDMRYSRLNKPPAQTNPTFDIQLQNLDAHSLLISKGDRNVSYRQDIPSATNSSPASSSLDLEWEHEYNNTHSHSWLMLPQEITIDEMSSENDDDSSTRSSSTSSSNSSKTSSHFSKSMVNVMAPKHSTSMQRQNTKRITSKSSWSHISTPDSLEWDANVDDNQLKSEEDFFDNETMELLQEIEWLKNRALNETGENLRDLLESES